MTGRVFRYESFSTSDGDGIRAVIFLSGCPLRCNFCHNPDSWTKGETVTSDEILSRIRRARNYYKRGGVTISGGEPLLQGEFVVSLLEGIKDMGLSTAIETSASHVDRYTDRIIELTDQFFVDLKFATEEEYRRYTGGSLGETLDFIKRLEGKRVTVRTVVIPGFNDTEDSIRSYLPLVPPHVASYELLAFHTLGFPKYEELGIVNPLLGVDSPPKDTMERLKATVNEYMISR